MELSRALKIAQRVVKELEPHCERIAIAGSIRRKKPQVKDIEIVAIPKPYDIGLFSSGIALVVNQWQKVKGELPCKYTQRILPEGIKLDLFFATRNNWGLIFPLRTGSAAYSRKVLAPGWVKHGYRSVGEQLHHERMDFTKSVKEEEELFELIGIPWVPPEERELT